METIFSLGSRLAERFFSYPTWFGKIIGLLLPNKVAAACLQITYTYSSCMNASPCTGPSGNWYISRSKWCMNIVGGQPKYTYLGRSCLGPYSSLAACQAAHP